ncbi:MAG: type II toxin-antitoxin system VapC family toxin [Anaerolineales bacterium]|nr:type II toxin-antitoxin system VapC family toxin [Anaerolineales bacterium]
MNVVDSSGWLEYFGNGRNADFFAPIVQDLASLVVPTVSLYEVFKRILLERTESEALQAVAVMHQGKVVDLNETIALTAAKLSLQHKLPMADALILATAKSFNATLWTQDIDFEGLSNVQYIAK